LLMDYPPEQQRDILDFLFKPNFGAGLTIIKIAVPTGAAARAEDDFEVYPSRPMVVQEGRSPAIPRGLLF
jgi:hypothetical protein